MPGLPAPLTPACPGAIPAAGVSRFVEVRVCGCAVPAAASELSVALPGGLVARGRTAAAWRGALGLNGTSEPEITRGEYLGKLRDELGGAKD
jgi:hypothetical protein